MNHSTNPVEMYSSGTVVAASLVVTVAAVALTLAFLAPSAAVVAAAGVFVASTAYRLYGLQQASAQEATVPTAGVHTEG